MLAEDSRPPYLLYGANGYTGRLIVAEADRRGIPLIVAGRRKDEIYRLAEQHHRVARVFSLNDPLQVAAQLGDVRLVLNCAGPFEQTAEPLVEACLKTGTHYLDVTGEIDVIERIAARHERAATAGVVLMPSVGFDVVPSDCLAARLADAVPNAKQLQLAFSTALSLSPGTAKTLLRRTGKGGQVRRDGQIVSVPTAYKRAEIEFPSGKRWAMTIPWGDVSMAFHTTQIPNIEVYVALPDFQIRQMRRFRWLETAARLAAVQLFGRWLIGRLVHGPSDQERQDSHAEFWGRVADEEGRAAEATLKTPDGYSLTVQTAIEIVRRVLDGHVAPGFQTPGRAFGGQLLDELSGVTFQWKERP